MTAREDVAHVLEKALQLIDVKEGIYGDAWKTGNKSVCVAGIFDKANYIRVQWERDLYTPERFMEDLLDLVAWASFSYWHVEQEAKE